MSSKLRLILSVCLAVVFTNCFAFTAIATIEGQVDNAWWRSSNYASQKEADRNALEGCRAEARRNGAGALAKKCKIVSRAKGPGYGAVVCGDEGCNWVTGHASGQIAVDAAYAGCNKSYKNCQSKDIEFWSDFAGFPSSKAAKPSGGNCRPRTTTLRCQSACTNGDCIITYENGCKMRVQVSPEFDSFQNRWVYPQPPC